MTVTPEQVDASSISLEQASQLVGGVNAAVVRFRAAQIAKAKADAAVEAAQRTQAVAAADLAAANTDKNEAIAGVANFIGAAFS